MFLFSLCVNMFFGLVIYGLIYLLVAQVIDSFWLNGLLFAVCFVVAFTIWNKIDPYEKVFQPLALVTRLVGAGVVVFFGFFFGF